METENAREKSDDDEKGMRNMHTLGGAKAPRTASQNGRRSRVKGKVWERAVSAMLRPHFPEAKRGFQSRSGRDGCDVEHTPWWVECKHGKCVNVRAALAQAVEATDGRPPLVVAKDDRTEPFVAMRLADFVAMIGASSSAAAAEA